MLKSPLVRRMPGWKSRWNDRFATAASVALLLLQPVLFFWHTLINPVVHIPYDIESYHYPLIAYVASCIRHRVAPFWDPYTYCGMPLDGVLTAQMFYPPVWLAILLGNL